MKKYNVDLCILKESNKINKKSYKINKDQRYTVCCLNIGATRGFSKVFYSLFYLYFMIKYFMSKSRYLNEN